MTEMRTFEKWLKSVSLGGISSAVSQRKVSEREIYEWMESAYIDGQDDAIKTVARIMKAYIKQCEKTGCDLSEKTDETSNNMYWRADGAADALEAILQEILAMKKRVRWVRSQDGFTGA